MLFYDTHNSKRNRYLLINIKIMINIDVTYDEGIVLNVEKSKQKIFSNLKVTNKIVDKLCLFHQ